MTPGRPAEVLGYLAQTFCPDLEPHRVWGLGVPLIRLPLDTLARPFCSEGFPNRLTLVLWMVFGAVAVRRGLQAVLSRTEWQCDPDHARIRIVSYLLTILLVLAGHHVNLLRTRLSVYEEAVIYGQAGALLGLGLFLKVAVAPRPGGVFVALAACAGLLPLIRPTTGAYGPFLLLAAWFTAAPRLSSRSLAAGAGVYFGLVGLLLASNGLRFGDPFEFGHSLNIGTQPEALYATRSCHPYGSVPLHVAAGELLSLLFGSPSLNGNDVYRRHFFAGQPDVHRWRELYFSTFNLSHAAGLFAATVLVAWALAKGGGTALVRIGVTVWMAGVAALGALFAFYLYCPVIASRYLHDLGAGMLFAQLGGILCLLGGLRSAGIAVPLLCSLPILFQSLFTVFSADFIGSGGFERGPNLRHSDARSMREVWAAASAARLPGRMPESYPRDLVATGIPLNGSGWSLFDHTVSSCVTLFIPDHPEVVLEFDRPVDGADFWLRTQHTLVAAQSIGANSLRFQLRPSGSASPSTNYECLFLGTLRCNRLGQSPGDFRLTNVFWR